MSDLSDEKEALAATLRGMNYSSTYGAGSAWLHQAAQLLASDWLAGHDAKIVGSLNRQMAKATVLAYDQGREGWPVGVSGMSDLTPEQRNHLRDCALISFDHLNAAVERILADLRESIAADIEALADSRYDHARRDLDLAAAIARGGEHV